MKALVVLVVILQIFYEADSKMEHALKCYYQDKESKEFKQWDDSITEAKTADGFQSKGKFSSERVLPMKREALTPTVVLDSCKFLLDNAIEADNKIIPLPSPWQLLNLTLPGIELPQSNQKLKLKYSRLELSAKEKVIFVGRETFSDKQCTSDALKFLRIHEKAFTIARLLGSLPINKAEVNMQMANEIDTKITDWLFVEPSTTIHSEQKWPAKWYYLRSTTDPILLNIPEENEIIVSVTQIGSKKPINPLPVTTNWRDSDMKQYLDPVWLKQNDDDWIFEKTILEVPNSKNLLPANDATPLKFWEKKILGAGNIGRVTLGKDLNNLGYMVVKQGGELLDREYEMHSRIYRAANGMQVNGMQRLRIPTPLFFNVSNDEKYRMGMSAAGPSLAHPGFIKFGAEEDNAAVFWKYIVPQMIIQLHLFHKTGYLHLDIKPGNFLFGPWGQEHLIFITDFGTCLQYCDGLLALTRIGSPPYMSISITRTSAPHPVGWKDDWEPLIYSVYEIINGILPWINILGDTDEEIYQKYAESKSATFEGSKPKNVDDEVWKRMKLWFLYITSLEVTEKPNLQHMLDILNLDKPIPDVALDSKMLDNVNDVIPDIKPPTDIKKTIFGIPSSEWRRYKIYEITKGDGEDFTLIEPKNPTTKPTLYLMEDAIMKITNHAPNGKYQGNVDFAVHYKPSSSATDDDLHYVFLFPGVEEFFLKSDDYRLVLVTSLPLDIAVGLFKFELFEKFLNLLHLKPGETLESKGVLDPNIITPSSSRIIRDIKNIHPDSKAKTVENGNTFLKSSFDNWHLPFFTES